MTRSITVVLALLSVFLAVPAHASQFNLQPLVTACTASHAHCLVPEKDAQKDVIAACKSGDISCRIHQTAALIAINKMCMDALTCCLRDVHGMKAIPMCTKLAVPPSDQPPQ